MLRVERVDEHLTAAEAASMLQWWLDAGVDTVVGEVGRDWLKPAPPPPPVRTEAAAVPAPAAPAARAQDLPLQMDLFQAWLRTSDALPFAAPSAPRVCPSGDPAAGLMTLIDMPTAEDCGAGTLLSGEAGRLYDRMLAAIGRDRSSTYFAALSCVRPADGRLAGPPQEQCTLLARHHIGLAKPNALLILGDGASKALLGLAVPRARGRWHEIATHAGPVRAIVTVSPHQLLLRPADKVLAWADLQMLMEGLNG